MVNPVEMGSTQDQVVEQPKGIPGYLPLFAAAFAAGPGRVNFANAEAAIAAFEQSLSKPDAPFDRSLRGHDEAMTAEQQAGLRVFMDQGCAVREGLQRQWTFARAARTLRRMIGRFAAMLAILAITVVTTVASAHAARMGVKPCHDHAAHVGETIPSPDVASDVAEAGGEDDQHCGSADAGICDFICAGLWAFPTSPGAAPGQTHASACHYLPRDTHHVSRVPGLNERPPRLRLL